MLLGEDLEQRALRVFLKFARLEKIHADDDLQFREAGCQFEQNRNEGEGANNGSQLGVVDDVFGGIGTECRVQSDGKECLGRKTAVYEGVRLAG